LDSGDAVHGGCVIQINGLTRERALLSHGGLLALPFGIVVTPDRRILVTDRGRLIEVEAATGQQTLLADLGCAAGLTLEHDGNLLIAGLRAILRYDLTTGRVTLVATGGHLTCVFAVAEAPNGDLWALNAGCPARLIRVAKHTGQQRVISQGGLLHCPQSLVAHGPDVYVTDVATADGNFGVGCILRINGRNGKQTELSRGGYLVGPVGITLDPAGFLVVGDPYTINPTSSDLYDGAILRIHPRTGEQELICRGACDLVNPRGVAILPLSTPGPGHHIPHWQAD